MTPLLPPFAPLENSAMQHLLYPMTEVIEGCHAAWALTLCSLMKLFSTLSGMFLCPCQPFFLIVFIVAMVTDGMQDDVMGETTSREEERHSCKLLDAVFHALHKSMSTLIS